MMFAQAVVFLHVLRFRYIIRRSESFEIPHAKCCFHILRRIPPGMHFGDKILHPATMSPFGALFFFTLNLS